MEEQATTPLEPIDSGGLKALAEKGKNDPSQVRTVKCRTVAERRFRHLNYVRSLPAHVIDEPPQLLGDDTAPNPSEAALAALGTCVSVGIHANAVNEGITINKLELELEADINITSVWGVGDTSEKPVGFTDVRIKANIDADVPRDKLEELLQYVLKWSPVTGTYRNPVPVSGSLG
jgi:uncharacterized OsmC-like protein